MKKSTLIMILSLIMAVAVGMGSTVAYLQDTDADVNVMTLGKVTITQNEQERNADGELVPFTPNKPAFPAVGPIEWAEAGEGVDVNGTEYMVFTDELKNVVDKIVTVTNTGKSDAYVRTIVAIEAPEYDPNDLIHVNVNGDISNTPWTPVDIEGVQYVYSVFTYPDALAPKMTTVPSLMQLFLDSEAGNDDIEKFGENWEVLVLSQAVQTQGFADAETALNTAFGEPNAVKVVEWFTGIEDNIGTPGDKWPDNNPPFFAGDDVKAEYEVPADAYRVTSSAELKAAVAAGETTLLLAAGEYDIDGCGGKTLTLIGEDMENTVLNVVGSGQGEANGQLDYGFDSSTVTFQNLTIQTNNATYAGYARLDGTYKNVNFDNCYCLNGDSTFENCTFNVAGDQYNVWTWGAPTATFTNCTFNSDGKAVLLYGQANTKLTLDLCLFNDTGVLPDLKAAVEIGNDYDKSYELIVNNTVVNGYEINNKGINTGTTLWANKNSMPQDKLNVVVDGVDVY